MLERSQPWASGVGVRGVLAAGAALALLGAADAAMAQGEDAGAPAEPAQPPVALDALFRLPEDTSPGSGPPGQDDERREWEERFAAVRAELDQSRDKLARAQSELEAMARNVDNWRMAAPGAKHDPETSPISYKLRNDIRSYREEIDAAERRLRELEVEASLAGIPAEWRRPRHEDAAPGSNARR